MELLVSKNRIVITHGNGPKVGNLLLAFESAKGVVPAMPLNICGAATQGFMGYMIRNTLANALRDADILFILTAVEYVFRDFGLPSQKALNHLKLAEAKQLLAEGQFGVGSMEPKIEAAIELLVEKDGEIIITLPETAVKALQGKTGTRITR